MPAVTPAEPLSQRVYAALSDRGFHSGAQLARSFGVSRSAVWKAIAALRELGVTVHAVANRGYRLPEATALLDAEVIARTLPVALRARLRTASTLWHTGSTNADLLQRPAIPPGRFDFESAEYQSAGRGRRSRSWFAPPGGALCLSLSWSFAALPPDFGALSLAIGVCVLRALRQAGVGDVNLKWPNDLVSGADKLGGILIELRAEAGGPALVVIGVGLNVALGEATRRQIADTGTRPADLFRLGLTECDRNALAAALLTQCVEGLLRFEREGLAAFAGEWRAADALAGKPVVVSGDSGQVVGHARGIDADGALCVQTREGLQRFVTGDVSVRAVSA